MTKKVYRSFAGYGVDIAEHRADDLDKRVLSQVGLEAVVLELGCGAMGLSKRLAEKGVTVLAVDIDDFSTEVPVGQERISFNQTDMRKELDIPNLDSVTDIVMQRTLHYLSYAEAKKLLQSLYKLMKKHSTVNCTISGKLFISVSGLDSEIGQDLVEGHTSLDKRFSLLTPAGQEKFFISKPVCLYTEAEFRNLLIETGWRIDEMWVSAFKNLKAVCSHRKN